MATQNDVTAALAYLTAVYQNWTIGPEVVAVWHDALQDLDGHDVVEACRQHVRGDVTGRYPIPGKIRDLAIEARRVRGLKSRALPPHEKPPATPEQIRKRCAEAIAKIAAAPSEISPPARNKALDGGAGTTKGPEKLDFKKALAELRHEPDEDQPWG